MKWMLWFVTFFIANSALAVVLPPLPKGCLSSEIKYQGHHLILHTSKHHHPYIFLLQNISHQSVMIDHQVRYPSASAGWGSRLRPKYWSAMMVMQPNFSLVCSVRHSTRYLQVPCKTVLRACHYKRFEDHEHNATGTYWVAENAPLKKLFEKIEKRKIIIPYNLGSDL